HRRALLEAAASGNPRYFLGTDSAPHPRHAKETACGCAGIYTAHAGIELYAEAFESAGALDRLEAFASRHGARFYGLAENTETLTLVREPWTVPDEIDFGPDRLVPMRAGATVAWRLASSGGDAAQAHGLRDPRAAAPPDARSAAGGPVDLRLRLAHVGSGLPLRGARAGARARLSPRLLHLFQPLARDARAAGPGARARPGRRLPGRGLSRRRHRRRRHADRAVGARDAARGLSSAAAARTPRRGRSTRLRVRRRSAARGLRRQARRGGNRA